MSKTHDIYGDESQSFENQIEPHEALKIFEQMEIGDSTKMVFAAKIDAVCKKKGCWMKLRLSDDKESRVMFKDYGFFVPIDSQGKEAIVSGWAYKSKTSVDDLKHYAEDAGKSTEEIKAITKPRIDYSFIANAVLIQKEI